eukprot:Nk52_evm52s2309 gene=Nk52_evmTU52s2309
MVVAGYRCGSNPTHWLRCRVGISFIYVFLLSTLLLSVIVGSTPARAKVLPRRSTDTVRQILLENKSSMALTYILYQKYSTATGEEVVPVVFRKVQVAQGNVATVSYEPVMGMAVQFQRRIVSMEMFEPSCKNYLQFGPVGNTLWISGSTCGISNSENVGATSLVASSGASSAGDSVIGITLGGKVMSAVTGRARQEVVFDQAARESEVMYVGVTPSNSGAASSLQEGMMVSSNALEGEYLASTVSLDFQESSVKFIVQTAQSSPEGGLTSSFTSP